jgi:hypothetical protein
MKREFQDLNLKSTSNVYRVLFQDYWNMTYTNGIGHFSNVMLKNRGKCIMHDLDFSVIK